MAVLTILFRRGTPRRLRMMAAANVFACVFVTVMTFLTTFISFFIIVPVIFKDNERLLFVHRSLIAYLFINVCGNFVLCLLTDTSTSAGKTCKRPARHKPTLASRTISLRKGNVSGKNSNSKKTGSLDDSVSADSSVSNNDTKPDVQVGRENASSSTLTNSDVLGSASGNTAWERQTSGRVSASQSANAGRSSRRKAKVDPPSGKDQKDTNLNVPERSHTCKLCEKRILRRDHHCFFMTVCIGYYNHKHFIFFCLYMMIGALYGVVLTVRFLHVLYNIRFWGPQTFVFLMVHVLYSVWVRGVVPTPFFLLLLYQLYVCLAVGLVAGGFLYWHLAITANGQTTHEASHRDGRYRRGLRRNLGDVLGHYWPLLFLLPLPLPQAGDGRSYTASPSTTKTTTKPTATATATTTTTTSTTTKTTTTTTATPAKTSVNAKGSNGQTSAAIAAHVSGGRGDLTNPPTGHTRDDNSSVPKRGNRASTTKGGNYCGDGGGGGGGGGCGGDDDGGGGGGGVDREEMSTAGSSYGDDEARSSRIVADGDGDGDGGGGGDGDGGGGDGDGGCGKLSTGLEVEGNKEGGEGGTKVRERRGWRVWW